jgi:hypothetical protein
MAVKQVDMPTTVKTNQYEAQFIANGHQESINRHNARMDAMRKRIEQAEDELDTLLNDGFEIVGQYNTETQNIIAVTFILHKREAEE